MLKIAEGEGDIYPKFFPTSECDICSAYAILNEADGKCVDAKTQKK